MAVENINLDTLLEITQPQGQINNVSFFTDATGDLFVGARMYGDTQLHVFQYHDIHQPAINDWQFTPSGNNKADSFSIGWEKSQTAGRANLLVLAGVPVNNRAQQRLEIGHVADACAYSEGMMTGMHGLNNSIDGAQDPGPVDLTPVLNAIAALDTRVQGVAAATQTRIEGDFGGNVRTGIQQKAEDALLHMIDPANNDPKAQTFRYLWWQLILNTGYSADMSAIHDSQGHAPLKAFAAAPAANDSGWEAPQKPEGMDELLAKLRAAQEPAK